MIKLNGSHLGYERSIKSEMQKSRVSNILNKYIRYNNEIMTQAEFAVNMLLDGFNTIDSREEQHYKRDGELTKSVMEYTFSNEQTNRYFTVPKTLYNFGIYIQENKLDNEKSIIEFVQQEEIEKKEAERKQLELEKLEEEKAKQELENERRYKEWLNKEIEKYKNIDRLELAKEIFENEIGSYREYNLKKLLVLIDNINNNQCRQNLILWLHSGNKASKKVFYHITGIKLPTTNKGTEEILNNLSIKDFKESVPFKARKLRNKDKELEVYYEVNIIPEPHFVKCEGEKIFKEDMVFFIRKNNKNYTITEARSGYCLTQGNTKKEVIENLNNVIKHHGIKRIKEMADNKIEYTGLSPLYK